MVLVPVPRMSGCPFLQISLMILSLSSKRWARSNSSAEVNTFTFPSNVLWWLPMGNSVLQLVIVASTSPTLSSFSSSSSSSSSLSSSSSSSQKSFSCFLSGVGGAGVVRGLQEIRITNRQRVSTRPKHTPMTK